MTKNATLTSTLLIKKGTASPVPPSPDSVVKITYHKSMTVKLDRERYEKLKKAGIVFDEKSQAIFLAALDLWFEKHAEQLS